MQSNVRGKSKIQGEEPVHWYEQGQIRVFRVDRRAIFEGVAFSICIFFAAAPAPCPQLDSRFYLAIYLGRARDAAQQESSAPCRQY